MPGCADSGDTSRSAFTAGEGMARAFWGASRARRRLLRGATSRRITGDKRSALIGAYSKELDGLAFDHKCTSARS